MTSIDPAHNPLATMSHTSQDKGDGELWFTMYMEGEEHRHGKGSGQEFFVSYYLCVYIHVCGHMHLFIHVETA